MNDIIYRAQVWLTEGGLSPYDTGFKLNDIPMSALGKPRGYQKHLGFAIDARDARNTQYHWFPADAIGARTALGTLYEK